MSFRKNSLLLITIISLIVLNQYGSLHSKTIKTKVYKGDYFGQKPPGLKAEMFAGGDFVPNEKGETRCFNVAFSPAGDEMFFSYYKATKEKPEPEYEIKTFKRVDDVWEGPETASFSGKYWDVDINFSPDGNYIFFASDRPQPNSMYGDIYYCVKTENGWSAPIYAGTEVNSIEGEVYPSVSKKGNVFFRSSRSGGYGKSDIYRAEWVNGNFINVKNLGPNVNTIYGASNAVIASDESYILFCTHRPEDDNKQRIYVSFQIGDNVWTKAVPASSEMFSEAGAGSPTISPDGKYIFFKKGVGEERGIYWISSKVIENLKKEIVK